MGDLGLIPHEFVSRVSAVGRFKLEYSNYSSAHRLARKHVLHGPEGDRVLAMCQEAGLGHHLDYDIKRLLQLSKESTKQLT